MRVLFWGFDYERAVWQDAIERLGMKSKFLASGDCGGGVSKNEKSQNKEQGIVQTSENAADAEIWDVLIVSASPTREAVAWVVNSLATIPPIIAIGAEAIAAGVATVEPKITRKVNEYVYCGGIFNYVQALRYIEKYGLSMDTPEPEPPRSLPFQGIFDFSDRLGDERVWDSLGDYRDAIPPSEWSKRMEKGCVGILTHRELFVQEQIQTEKAIAKELWAQGILPILCFHNGLGDGGRGQTRLADVLERDFSLDGELKIQALIMLSAHSIGAGSDGRDAFEEANRVFSKWNIPVFHPIISMFCAKKQWEEESSPLAGELSWSYVIPETQGMTEPVFLAYRDEKGRAIPIPDRVNYFCRRLRRYIRLRKKDNGEKRVALILHNSVCAGVEATIGQAFGLDAFDSAVSIMRRLKKAGYRVEDIPSSGAELYQRIQEKKAISDFRWTTSADIVASGGCLYEMGLEEYRVFYNNLPKDARDSLEKTWGTPPGEGMTLNGKIIISGLAFGNLIIMVQPKRGCHKAKCTGEVCKILHDPFCPPPHQYFAAYRYIGETFDADCCIHLGTEGSLEYLPGKQTGLSRKCWPDIAIGELPNFYLYHAGVPGEASPAKRRSYAVLLDYFPAPYGGVSEEVAKLAVDIDDYFQAKELENGQAEEYEKCVRQGIHASKEAARIMESCETFEEGLRDIRFYIENSARRRRLDHLHVFGSSPSDEDCFRFIEEVWGSDESILNRFTGKDVVEKSLRMRQLIMAAVADERGHGSESRPSQKELESEARELYQKIKQCDQELDCLLNALSGGFVSPGESGMPDENGRNILPTGRNMFTSDAEKVPTPIAYARGQEMAKKLIAAYKSDEGCMPEKVAVNMTSLDITRSKGELLAQCLFLMGIRPVWDEKKRVLGLEAIPLSELGRPRIDITVRITGVLRDSWPKVINLLDEAVMLAASQNERDDENFVRAHTARMLARGVKDGTARVFGDPPGVYGAGVDLALLASAWETDEDLAKYYIHHSAYAYGKERNGEKRIGEFVENVRMTDLSYDVTNTRRMDVLDCGFGTQIQGGMRLVTKSVGGKEIRQYQGVSELGKKVFVQSLKSRYEEALESTLLNPFWQESVKEQGYIGAAEVMCKLQNLFMDQCLNELLDDKTIDRVVDECVNAEHMKEFMMKVNPYAYEESLRRFLELSQREKWEANEEVLGRLRENYIEIEGDMESGLSSDGDAQGGTVEILNDRQVESWANELREVNTFLREYSPKLGGSS